METRLQRERRERAKAKAAGLHQKADQQFEDSRKITEHIPLGQPILVGHHSERHHRRDLERSHRKMGQAVETHNQAKAADWAAKNAGYAITLDDPEAVQALTAKLEEMERDRDTAKAINKAHRKGGFNAVAELVGEKKARTLIPDPEDKEKPYPTWFFTNLGARIRTTKKRLEELQREAKRGEEKSVMGNGFTIDFDKEDCRVRFYFMDRPDKATCKEMRRAGFKFSRTFGAWQRLLNDNGRRAALRMASELFDYNPDAKLQEAQNERPVAQGVTCYAVPTPA